MSYGGPIIDTHMHVYRAAAIPTEGICGAPVMRRDYTMADYRRAMGGADVRSVVVLNIEDRGCSEHELAHVRGAAADRLIGGYVAFAPVDTAEGHAGIGRLAADPLVRGVRYNQAIALDGRMDERAIDGVRLLGELGLHFEMSVRPMQCDSFVRLASAAPDTAFVSCNLGRPSIRSGWTPEWEASVRRMARLPNVFCKVTAAVETADDPPFDLALMKPLIRVVLDAFGPDRVLYGSNYPACRIAIELEAWLSLLAEATRGASAHDLARLYHDNAAALYRADR